MFDTFEALEEDAVESLIDQSTSLRFVGYNGGSIGREFSEASSRVLLESRK
jgi:hypothetical protein